jgi:chitodextrinase
VEAPRPSLYEKFAADYERKRQKRKDSFSTDAAGQPPTSPATDQQEASPAGTFAQATGLRQDDHNADRADRIATGAEPESTRFAGGSAFGVKMGRGYEMLDRTYAMLSGRRSA